MRGVNLRRGFNRLFIFLAACWAVYWLFVFPFVAATQGFNHYKKDVKSCRGDLWTCRNGFY